MRKILTGFMLSLFLTFSISMAMDMKKAKKIEKNTGYTPAHAYIDEHLTEEEKNKIYEKAVDNYKNLEKTYDELKQILSYYSRAMYITIGGPIIPVEDVIPVEKAEKEFIQPIFKGKYKKNTIERLLFFRQIARCDWRTHVTNVYFPDKLSVEISQIISRKINEKVKEKGESLLKDILPKTMNKNINISYDITRFIIEAVYYITCEDLKDILNNIAKKPYKLNEYLDDDRILTYITYKMTGKIDSKGGILK